MSPGPNRPNTPSGVVALAADILEPSEETHKMDNLDNKAKTSGTGAGLNRRDVMVTAAVAAVVAGSSTVVAEPAPAANFGAPLVELHVPAGVLTVEQRGAMIKGVTEVVVEALGQPVGPTKRLFVEIIETAEGGYGVNGQAFVPRPR